MSDINEADLTALLAELRDHAANGYKTCQYAALTALVAERYRLGKCVVELERRLESNPPADRDLRERLVESALRGAGTGAARSVKSSMLTEDEAEALGRQAVWMAEGAFYEMRKGGGDGK